MVATLAPEESCCDFKRLELLKMLLSTGLSDPWEKQISASHQQNKLKAII
jgi:hypothetical protein